jgi:hypothetical protein
MQSPPLEELRGKLPPPHIEHINGFIDVEVSELRKIQVVHE